MKKARTIIEAAGALLVLSFCAALILIPLRELVNWLNSLQQGAALLIVAVVSPAVTYMATRAIEQRKLTGTASLDRKIKLYDSVIFLFMRTIGMGEGEAPSEGELEAAFAKMTPDLVVYASNGVLREWVAFKQISRDANDEDRSDNGAARAAIFQFEKLLKAIRKDLGHNVFLLSRGDILGAFVNDIRDYV